MPDGYPHGNYRHQFTFTSEPVFGGTAHTAVCNDCGHEWWRTTWSELEQLARYGHDC